MKTIILLLVFTFSTQVSFAQRSEVAARIGAGSIYQLLEAFESNVLLNKTPEAIRSDKIGGISPISIQYRSSSDDFFSVSMEVQYMSVIHNVDNINTNEQIGVLSTRFYSVMPGFQLNYFDNNVVGLSTGFALGIGFRYKSFEKNQTVESENRTLLATQIDVLKLRFGKKFNVFTDIGVGTRSLITFGVGYRF